MDRLYPQQDSAKEVIMSDKSTIRASWPSGGPDAAAAMLAAQRLWQLPLTLYTSWWNAGVETLWPHMPHPHHRAHHDEHDQLVVPEPIEAEGEHALFA
ncbi:hypothetical protein BF95_21580 [Sphingobium sp. Ant17]|nr:hypothetical protein BF95_21580 [Sphingobium sp. Ant17]